VRRRILHRSGGLSPHRSDQEKKFRAFLANWGIPGLVNDPDLPSDEQSSLQVQALCAAPLGIRIRSRRPGRDRRSARVCAPGRPQPFGARPTSQHPVGSAPVGRCPSSFARLAPAAASIRAVRSQRLPFRVFPDLCLPALSLFPGQRAAQLAQLQFPFKERVGLGAMTGKFVESGPGPGKPRSRTASSEADCKTRTDER